MLITQRNRDWNNANPKKKNGNSQSSTQTVFIKHFPSGPQNRHLVILVIHTEVQFKPKPISRNFFKHNLFFIKPQRKTHLKAI